MTGSNVLHALGYDAFGLPAEQYAVQTGQHPRVTTMENVANMRRQLRRLGLAHDPRRSVSTTDPSFYRWTQWIFLQIFNSWYDTEAERARPIEELIAAFESGDAAHARRSPVGRAEPGRAAPAGRRPPAGLHLRGAGELVPGPGHRAGQRGGHRRRALRPRQLPGVQAQPQAVDDADHRLRRPAAGRPGPARLARVHQADAAELDRPVRGRSHRLPGRRRRHRGRHRRVHDPARHAVRRDLHGAGARASPGRRAAGADVARGHAGDLDRRGRHAQGGRRGLPATGRVQERRRTPGGEPGQDRRLPGRPGAEPRDRRAHPGLRRRLRADGLRHRRHHGRAGPGRAGLGVRRGLRPAHRPHGRSRPTAGRAARTRARGRR